MSRPLIGHEQLIGGNGNMGCGASKENTPVVKEPAANAAAARPAQPAQSQSTAAAEPAAVAKPETAAPAPASNSTVAAAKSEERTEAADEATVEVRRLKYSSGDVYEV